jgi:hypothetical protein
MISILRLIFRSAKPKSTPLLLVEYLSIFINFRTVIRRMPVKEENDDRLQIYGDWFLSELCRRAKGSVDSHFDRTEIFDALHKEAFKDETKSQAIDEIVHHLSKQGWITIFEGSDDVRLTDAGLARC